MTGPWSLAPSFEQENMWVQGYLAHKKSPTPLGPPQGPMLSRTAGSLGGAFSYERGTPVDPER